MTGKQFVVSLIIAAAVFAAIIAGAAVTKMNEAQQEAAIYRLRTEILEEVKL